MQNTQVKNEIYYMQGKTCITLRLVVRGFAFSPAFEKQQMCLNKGFLLYGFNGKRISRYNRIKLQTCPNQRCFRGVRYAYTTTSFIRNKFEVLTW